MRYHLPPWSCVLAAIILTVCSSALADDTGEAKAKAHWESYKNQTRKNQENVYRNLAKEAAKIAGLDDKQTESVVKAVQPAVEKAVDYWRCVYRLHYLDHYKEEGDSHFWDDFGDALTTAEAKQAKLEIKTAWEAALAANLKPDAIAKWNAEVEARKSRAIKAYGPAEKKRTEAAFKSHTTLFEEKIADLVQDAGLQKEQESKLQEGMKVVSAQFQKDYLAQLAKCQPDWDLEFSRLGAKPLENLEKKGSFSLYLPRQTELNNQTQTAFDAMVDKVLSPEEHKRVADARERHKKRIAEAAKKMLESMKERQGNEANLAEDGRIGSIAAALHLTPERQKALEKRVDDANKTALAEWAKVTLKTIESDIIRHGQSRGREQFMKEVEAGNWYFHDNQADEKLAAAKVKNFDDAIKAALSAEEVAKWQAFEKIQADRKATALARLVVSELDNKVKLLPEQRQKIEDLIMPVARDVAQLPGSLKAVIQYNSLDFSLMMLGGVEMTTLNNLLDKEQNSILSKSWNRYESYWTRLKKQIDGLKKKKN